jgi:putative membrane protein
MIPNRFLLILLSIGTVGLVCTATAQNTTTPSQIDKKFVRSALEGGKTEVLLGNLAVQKAGSEKVKQFGQKMIDDHTKLSERMRAVAAKEGISAHGGTAVKDKATVTRLQKLSGQEFDKAYIQAMVKDHKEDLDAFNREANSGNDTEIKDVAGQEAQVIGEHLKLAEQLARDHIRQQGQ